MSSLPKLLPALIAEPLTHWDSASGNQSNTRLLAGQLVGVISTSTLRRRPSAARANTPGHPRPREVCRAWLWLAAGPAPGYVRRRLEIAGI